MKFNDEKLRSLMGEKKYTLTKAEKELNISHPTFSAIYNGKAQPSIKTVNKIIKHFRIKDYTLLFK